MQLASSEVDELPSSTRAPVKKQPRLDDTEAIILVAAANRSDRIVLPVPDSINAPHDKVEAKLKRLLKFGLIEEAPAKLEDGRWRKDEEDRHITLRITAAGYTAVGIEPPDGLERATAADAPDREEAKRSRKPSGTSARSNSKAVASKSAAARKLPGKKAPKVSKAAVSKPNKSEKLLALLKRPTGATLAELIKSSGWQAHSVRGFLSAVIKKKLKLKLLSEEDSRGTRRYRVRAKAKG
jgi:hypothetical protein